MAGKGKRIKALLRAGRSRYVYELDAAVKFVKDNATAKFDETIEISMNFGCRSAAFGSDGSRRGSLPKGTGKAVRVAVFAKGEKADEAKAAGADVVGADDLAEKVESR